MSQISDIWEAFASHYDKRLNGAMEGDRTPPIPLSEVDQKVKTSLPGFYYDHPKLRPGNGPRFLYHGEKTRDVIVLTHGFTDSPFYMQAIGECFFKEGCNVLLPLLPAHGLKEPKKAILDESLDTKWRKTIDEAVKVAQLLGDRISIGGFSTGGALSLNKIVRDKDGLPGGLFLFSAALSLGKFIDKIGHSQVVEWAAGFFLDRKAIVGEGPDPYKYPVLPSSVASEIIEIIQENKQKLNSIGQIPNPVFAAHSQYDRTAEIQGVIDFLALHAPSDRQLFYSIQDEVMHSSLPLQAAVPIDLDAIGKEEKDPQKAESKKEEWLKNVAANPHFDEMMTQALTFFKQNVQV